MRAFRWLSLLVVGVLLLSACGGGDAASGDTDDTASETSGEEATEGGETEAAAGDVKVCFAYQDLETEFWVASHEAIIGSLNDQGVEVIERNANQDPNVQLEQIRDCITQGVDAILMIPQDGDSAVTIIGEANEAGVPIGVFARPPAPDNPNPALVVVADNKAIAEATVDHMVAQAEAKGEEVKPLIMVGDLGDPNAVERKDGFYAAIDKAEEGTFAKPIEVPTKWDAATALANLQSALQANPDVGMIFTSSDFMYPQIEAELKARGMWKKIGEDGHVILGGVDGDIRACNLMKDQYVDATGVFDLYYEADIILEELLAAVEAGEAEPEETLVDPGFALTQDNLSEKEQDTWGCILGSES